MKTSFTHRKVALSLLALLGVASFDALAAARGVVYCSGFAGSTQAGGIDTTNQFGVVAVSVMNPNGVNAVDIDRVRVRTAAGAAVETIADDLLAPIPKNGVTVLAPVQASALAATPGMVTIQVNWSQSADNRTEPEFKALHSLYSSAGALIGTSIGQCSAP
ncbi:MAG: hypothetical protein K2Y51_06250 [Gammaproteobacteria bacterium]|nr:hypothetical protein [Gammaproteobacteria bacterium]